MEDRIVYGASGTKVPEPEKTDECQSKRHLLQPVIVDTFTGLVISDLRAYDDGKLSEGVFILTNSTPAEMNIAAETVFATGLELAPNETYTVLVWNSDEVLTLETNGTGKSINFTAEVTLPNNGGVAFYVVANDD